MPVGPLVIIYVSQEELGEKGPVRLTLCITGRVDIDRPSQSKPFEAR